MYAEPTHTHTHGPIFSGVPNVIFVPSTATLREYPPMLFIPLHTLLQKGANFSSAEGVTKGEKHCENLGKKGNRSSVPFFGMSPLTLGQHFPGCCHDTAVAFTRHCPFPSEDFLVQKMPGSHFRQMECLRRRPDP